MTSISAVTLNALANDEARIERVASNLANVQTPGYKRELVAEQSTFASAMSVAAQDAVPAAGDDLRLPQVDMKLIRDMRPATLKPTGRTLDLALSGVGFFELGTDHGPAYTRRGDFQVDARGRIVNSEGHALLGQGGEITVTTDHVKIDGTGRVFDSDKQVAQLRVVDIAPNELQPMGGGRFVSSGSVQELAQGRADVKQGFLENANVDTAHEMVSLSATVRHFEALLRVVQGRDEMLGTAIRKLGDM
jgi:flagellar basal-body rod protein FlgF